MIVRGAETTKDIQDEFNLNFPFLRIEFLKEKIAKEGPVDIFKEMGDDKKNRIGDFITSGLNNEVEILPEQTIAELEEKFREVFNLNIEILSQSGNKWVKAMKTKYWSLAYQNEHAERLNGMLGNKR